MNKMRKKLINNVDYYKYKKKGYDYMAKKGVPKRDGSGRGVRANRGRGGCKDIKSTGKGRNRRT